INQRPARQTLNDRGYPSIRPDSHPGIFKRISEFRRELGLQFPPGSEPFVEIPRVSGAAKLGKRKQSVNEQLTSTRVEATTLAPTPMEHEKRGPRCKFPCKTPTVLVEVTASDSQEVPNHAHIRRAEFT